jgi:tetratricopeptide (TPR) repeat protein
LYERSLSIKEQQLGADHPDVATSLNNLASFYYFQGRYNEAEPLFGRSLSIREQQLGADHPDVANSLNNLAGLYESQGRYSEAELLYERAVNLHECHSVSPRLCQFHPPRASELDRQM